MKANRNAGLLAKKLFWMNSWNTATIFPRARPQGLKWDSQEEEM